MRNWGIPKRGSVCWLDLREFNPKGHEQSLKRPVAVISSEFYNFKGMCIICPITSKVKGYPFEVPILGSGAINGVILADQARTIDWRARELEFADEILPSRTIDEVAEKYYSIISN